MSNKIFKKFFLIGVFSVIGFLSLFIFGTNFCSAELQCITYEAPNPGAKDLPLSVLIEWSYSGNIDEVDSYEIRHARANTPDVDCSIIDEGEWVEADLHPNKTKTSFMLTGLSPDTRYCWKVRAEGSGGDGPWPDFCVDDIWDFTTETTTEENGNGNGGGGGGGWDYYWGVPIKLINPLECTDIKCAIDALIDFIFFLIMTIAPILILYSAFLLLTAHGDPTKLALAKKIILWAAVAIFISLLAKGFPNMVKTLLGGEGDGEG